MSVLSTEKLRDVIWHEDQSLLRTGNAPQVMPAITNLVITLFRLQGVTEYAAETRRNAQDPRRGTPVTSPFARLNTPYDFDESLATVSTFMNERGRPRPGPRGGRVMRAGGCPGRV